jgi:anti-sigma regulatory factor (Ser/Thr protein kinase)
VTLQAEIEATIGASREARQLVREKLGEQIPAPALCDLLTVVTELVANAIEYGEGAWIALTVELTPEEIKGKVQNRGTRMPELLPMAGAPRRGFGLLIVDTIAEGWEAFTSDGVTTVCFTVSTV